MAAGNRGVKVGKRSPPSADSIDWKLKGFSAGKVERTFEGVLLCLKKTGRRRWSDWEKHLVDYACWSETGVKMGLTYAREIVRRRWPEFEPSLIRHGRWLAEYLEWRGFSVGTGPLERLILGSKKHDIVERSYAAYLYAMLVLKDRWEEGELVILEAASVAVDAFNASRFAEAYRKRFFPRQSWPALNERIREGRCTPGFVVEYSRITGKNCNTDANDGLLKADRNAGGFTEVLWDYADVVLGRKLPDDLDDVMVLKSFENPDDPFVKKYMETYCK
jgi:hypothetical protein